MENFDVKEQVELVMNIQKLEASSKNIYLEVEYDLEDSFVITDPKRFAQVLLCLQSNAIKFTFEGGITIRVTRDNNFLVVEVIDTGLGIKLED